MSDVVKNGDNSECSLLNVKVQFANNKQSEFMIVANELILDLRQSIIDNQINRTCFALYYKDKELDRFEEVGKTELENGSVIKCVDVPYNLREARAHFRHIREFLFSSDQEAFMGTRGQSLSTISKIFKEENSDNQIIDYLLPGSDKKSVPFTALYPLSTNKKCFKVLSLSAWNPPPSNRQLKGDLFYMFVVTNDDRKIHITACEDGFYANNSTDDTFSPTPITKSPPYHSLIDLFSNISDHFKRLFNALVERNKSRDPLETVPTPIQTYPWFSPDISHTQDYLRAEDGFGHRLGFEENLPCNVRNWNEEYQSSRDVPYDTLTEKVARDRITFRVYCEMIATAVLGCCDAFNGSLMAVNHSQEENNNVYLWNNLFISMAYDVAKVFTQLGGDLAAHYAQNLDLQGISAVSSIDNTGIHTLGTVIVDYCGKRMCAQSMIAGIMEKMEKLVVYGLCESGETKVIKSNEDFNNKLEVLCDNFGLCRHKVWNYEGEEQVEVIPSAECKGIIGFDSRYYILDLSRFFPADINYLADDVPFDQFSEELKARGFPRSHVHKLCSIRNELVPYFISHKKEELIQAYVKIKEVKGVDSSSDDSECLKEALKEIGSLSESDLKIGFNPDLYLQSVRCVEGDDLEAQKRLNREICHFLVIYQIPFLVDFLMEESVYSGEELVQSMHLMGINVRYLGEVARLAEQRKLSFITESCIYQMISRAVKHVFKKLMDKVPASQRATSIVHILNCFLFRDTTRRGKKGKPKISVVIGGLDYGTFWDSIKSEVTDYFGYDLENVDFCSRIVLLRLFCTTLGIKIKFNNYSGIFEKLTSPPFEPQFVEDDIIGLFPRVKYPALSLIDSSQSIVKAKWLIKNGNIQDGYNLMNETMLVINEVFGPMHSQKALILSLLARVNYVMGEFTTAFEIQRHVSFMYERLTGIDSFETISSLNFLALYSFAVGKAELCLRLLMRIRYLSLFYCTEENPRFFMIDTCIGLVLLNLGMAEFAEKYFSHACDIAVQFDNLIVSVKFAFLLSLKAQSLAYIRLYREAICCEQRVRVIYSKELGDDNVMTDSSRQRLRDYTNHAVEQKRMINSNKTPDSSMIVSDMTKFHLSKVLCLSHLNFIYGIRYDYGTGSDNVEQKVDQSVIDQTITEDVE